MSETLKCPYCEGNVKRFTSGFSEYELGCEGCDAGFAIEAETGVVRTRRWDREARRGIHEEFPLERLRG